MCQILKARKVKRCPRRKLSQPWVEAFSLVVAVLLAKYALLSNPSLVECVAEVNRAHATLR